MNTETPKLMHVATVTFQNKGRRFLLLKQMAPFRFMWFLEESPGIERETGIWGGTAEEAIQEGRRNWRNDQFLTLHCGFRYTLPERDEVGTNALFHQMISSYRSSNGVYYDEELGSNCIVQNASSEARNLWKRLQNANMV